MYANKTKQIDWEFVVETVAQQVHESIDACTVQYNAVQYNVLIFSHAMDVYIRFME